MALITWTTAFSVGVREIDTQHQELIRLINDLHDAMREGKGRSTMGEILKRLIDYTVNHFGFEEKLFAETGYPESLAHTAEHASLTREVQALALKYESGQSVLSIEVMEFLRSWLTDHIKGVDKRYTAHLHSKGIR